MLQKKLSIHKISKYLNSFTLLCHNWDTKKEQKKDSIAQSELICQCGKRENFNLTSSLSSMRRNVHVSISWQQCNKNHTKNRNIICKCCVNRIDLWHPSQSQIYNHYHMPKKKTIYNPVLSTTNIEKKTQLL